MVYRMFADLILLLHLCYILFVIAGGFLLLRWRFVWKIHVPAVIWGFSVQYFVWMCPLTGLENYFRNLSGQAGYGDGFINYFLTALLYPGIGAWVHPLLGILILMINAGIYFYVFNRR